VKLYFPVLVGSGARARFPVLVGRDARARFVKRKQNRGDRVKKKRCEVVLSCVGCEGCQGPLCEEKDRIDEIRLRRHCVTLYFPVLVGRGARARFVKRKIE
jgi:hypothetical protein